MLTAKDGTNLILMNRSIDVGNIDQSAGHRVHALGQLEL